MEYENGILIFTPLEAIDAAAGAECIEEMGVSDMIDDTLSEAIAKHFGDSPDPESSFLDAYENVSCLEIRVTEEFAQIAMFSLAAGKLTRDRPYNQHGPIEPGA